MVAPIAVLGLKLLGKERTSHIMEMVQENLFCYGNAGAIKETDSYPQEIVYDSQLTILTFTSLNPCGGKAVTSKIPIGFFIAKEEKDFSLALSLEEKGNI